MKMLQRTALWIFVALCVNLQAQRPMSLDDCVQYALENHPEIKLAQLEIRDANWQIKENLATGLPQFSVGASYQYFLKQPAIPADAFGFEAPEGTKLTFALKNNLSGTVGVNQLIFNNSYLLGLKAAKEYRNYVDLKLEAAKAKLRNAVIDAYLPALLVTENIAILDKNITVQQDFLRETQEINKAGFAEQLDVDRLQYALTTLTNQKENLVRQRDILIDLLQFAIYMPVTEDISLSDDLSALLVRYADINPSEKLDYQNKPEYVALEKARDLSQIQVDLYKNPWLPTLSGFAQYQPSYQGNDKLFWIPSAIIGLQLSIPIYDGGGTRAKRERAIVSLDQVDIQKGMLEHAFDLQLETAKKRLENARVSMENEERNLNLAQRIYDTAQTKFEVGVGSSLELTEAQSGLYQSQARLMQARYELLESRVAFNKALGR